MGHPKRNKKKYERPRRPWVIQRIKEEKELAERYGLKNKREIWKANSLIRKYRREVRNILAEIAGMKPTEHTMKKQEAIMNRLKRYGIVEADAKLEDVLALDVEHLLERRLQTLVYRKGLANTIKQARQLIVHGHIAINGRRVTIPSYIVRVDEERGISYSDYAPASISAIATSGGRDEGREPGEEVAL